MTEPTIKTMIQWLRDDVAGMRLDIKQLQGFRWKFIGFASAFGAIGGILVGFLL